MNKFKILNAMQKSVSVLSAKDSTWQLKVEYTVDNVTRCRVVAFINRGNDGKYYTTMNFKGSYNNFMAALASLMQRYLQDASDLVASMSFPIKHENPLAEYFKDNTDYPVMPKHVQTFRRGAKKSRLYKHRSSLKSYFGI